MDGTKFLVVGSKGQLGKALMARFPKSEGVDREELDITDAEAVSAFHWDKFDTILNAAAFTNVDGAESADGRKAAWMINGQAVANLARVATENDMTFVHISSDYVFDGTHSPHTETESMAPLSVYGQSKAAGDLIVSTIPKHYILRTSWLIGDGPNFVRTMMGLAAKNISPKVVDDQIGRLTFTHTLVDGIQKLLESKAEPGTYNLTNGGEEASWAEITKTIFKDVGRDDLTVTGVTTAEYFKDKPEAAPRPLKSTLDLAKFKALGLEPRDWRTELAGYIKKEQEASR
jgi:dTDP-4-dehydrorhamnose reductase